MIRRSFRTICAVAASLLVLISFPAIAVAIPPVFVSDPELAESPLIVVAKWNGAPWVDNSIAGAKTLQERESLTEIEVSRVINGDVAPGKLKILVEPFVGWSAEQPLVMSHMSTEALGDADATTDNLWFLTKRRSLKDSKDYYELSNYRGVQPLTLEPYFKVLRSRQIKDQVAPLLRSGDKTVQLRTLELIAGGKFPWPFEPWAFLRPSEKRVGPPMPLKEHAEEVRSLAEKSDDPTVRSHAVAVYGFVARESSIDFMRTKLKDKDAEVRAIAVGTLVRYKDRVEAASIAEALNGLDEPGLACAVIKQLADWHDPLTVPALIQFLQNDGCAGSTGDDWEVPAIKSRAALLSITGHCFPFDVALSREAWQTAKEIADLEQRKRYLADAAPCDPNPWGAKLVIENEKFFVEITNRSKRPIALRTKPVGFSARWSRGLFNLEPTADKTLKNTDFVTIEPAKSHRFEIETTHLDNLKQALTTRSLTLNLAYMSNGNKVGVNAWLGIISIKPSDDGPPRPKSFQNLPYPFNLDRKGDECK